MAVLRSPQILLIISSSGLLKFQKKETSNSGFLKNFESKDQLIEGFLFFEFKKLLVCMKELVL